MPFQHRANAHANGLPTPSNGLATHPLIPPWRWKPGVGMRVQSPEGAAMGTTPSLASATPYGARSERVRRLGDSLLKSPAYGHFRRQVLACGARLTDVAP